MVNSIRSVWLREKNQTIDNVISMLNEVFDNDFQREITLDFFQYNGVGMETCFEEPLYSCSLVDYNRAKRDGSRLLKELSDRKVINIEPDDLTQTDLIQIFCM